DAHHGAHRACEFPLTRLLAGWSLAWTPRAVGDGGRQPCPLGGLEAARLELADGPLPLAPRRRLPFIPRPSGRAHDVYTPTCSRSVQPAWATSAYPDHYSRALAAWAILPFPRLAVRHFSLLRL